MKFSLIALALAAALPLSAQASEISYTYVEGDYVHTAIDTDLNNFSLDGPTLDGYKVKGSVAFGDSFYGIASYSDGNGDDTGFKEGVVGFGYRHAISGKADWDSELSFVSEKINYDYGYYSNSVIDHGARLATGMRFMMGGKWEGNFNVNYTDIGYFGNGAGVGIGAVFHINDTWGLTAGYDYSNRNYSKSNDNAFLDWTFGARASF